MFPEGEELVAQAGDVLGWYDNAGGAIGYSEDDDVALFPTIIATGQTVTGTTEGANSVDLGDAKDMVFRSYGVRVCYSEYLGDWEGR